MLVLNTEADLGSGMAPLTLTYVCPNAIETYLTPNN